MLLVRIIEIIKSMLTLGQVRLSKSWLFPHKVKHGFRIGPAGLEPPEATNNRKNNTP